MERLKWRTPRENVKVGDVVLMADENYPYGKWPIVRDVEAVADDDGFVRVVKVKTTSTVATHAKRQRRKEIKASTIILRRPIISLCCLDMDR